MAEAEENERLSRKSESSGKGQGGGGGAGSSSSSSKPQRSWTIPSSTNYLSEYRDEINDYSLITTFLLCLFLLSLSPSVT